MGWNQLNNRLVTFLWCTMGSMAIEVSDSAKSTATEGTFKWSGINLISEQPANQRAAYLNSKMREQVA